MRCLANLVLALVLTATAQAQSYKVCMLEMSILSQNRLLEGDAWLFAAERCRVLDPKGYEESAAENKKAQEDFKRLEPKLKAECEAKGWHWIAKYSMCDRQPW